MYDVGHVVPAGGHRVVTCGHRVDAGGQRVSTVWQRVIVAGQTVYWIGVLVAMLRVPGPVACANAAPGKPSAEFSAAKAVGIDQAALAARTAPITMRRTRPSLTARLLWVRSIALARNCVALQTGSVHKWPK